MLASFANFLQNGKTIATRHVDVEDNGGRLHLSDQLQRLLAVTCNMTGESLLDQPPLDQPSRHAVVVCDDHRSPV
jgi:hypothetical protein